MKTKIFFILFVFAYVWSWSQTNDLNSIFWIQQKKYYNKIFSDQQRQKLTLLYKQPTDNQKNWQKFNKFIAKANRFDPKGPIPKRKIKRYKRKYQKFASKAYSYGNVAITNDLKRFDEILKIYKKASDDFDKCKNPKQKVIVAKLDSVLKKLENNQKDLQIALKNATNAEEKFKVRKRIYENKKLIANRLQQKLAVCSDDKKIIQKLKKEFKISDKKTPKIVLNTKFQKKYNILKDTNILPSVLDNVMHKVEFTSEQLFLLNKAAALTKEGSKYLYLADSLYFINLQLQTYINKIKDKKVVQNLKNQFDKNKSLITQYKQKAWLNFINANKNYFTAYDSRMKQLLEKKKDNQVQKLIDTANYYYSKANGMYEFVQKNNDYDLLKLTLINKNYLLALEYYESAFALYFGEKPYPIPKVSNYIKPTSDTDKQKNETSKKKTQKKKPAKKTKKTNVKKNAVLYVYSSTQRTPQIAKQPKGKIYRIYIGQSVNLLPVNELPDYEPYYFQKHKDSKLKSFYVGSYTSIDEAKKALADLKKRGYPARIVVFDNGKKQVQNVKKAQNATNCPTNVASPSTFPDITQTKYLLYAIQIGTFSSPKTLQDLKNLYPIYQKNLDDGRIQYFLAPIYSYADAVEKLNLVKSKGFSDAFITAFNNGQKISISKAKKLEASINSNNSVIFRVQIGAFSEKLSDKEIQQKFGKIKAQYPIHMHTKNGLYVYSAGEATSFEQAKKIRDNIRNLGIKDAFVIAFKNGVQIPLSEALKN